MSSRRPSPHPAHPKATSDDDDDAATVDSDSAELVNPQVTPIDSAKLVATTGKKKKLKKSFKSKRNHRLTAISKKYDLDGDGQLDEAEQAMRDCDATNRGFLTNEEIYHIVKKQLKAKQKASNMKKVIAALICFVVFLAVSNLGTSMAAAFLAKDMRADNDSSEEAPPPAMRIASTGEVAAAQTTAQKYEVDEMSDEEYDERRRLVVEEIDEDPHSHQHRRELKKNVAECNENWFGYGCDDDRTSRMTYDVVQIDIDRFDKIEHDCKKQRNVNIERNLGNNKRSCPVCSRGTSVVVKERRPGNGKKSGSGKKGKKKNKKDRGRKGNKNRERDVIFEREDGYTLHASCQVNKCHLGGDVLLGRRGEACRLNRDDCESNLVCEKSRDKKLRSSSSKYGVCQSPTKMSTTVIRTGNSNKGKGEDWCDLTKNNACGKGYYCMPGEDFKVSGYGRSARAIAQRRNVDTDVGTCQRSVGRGQTCWDDDMCGPGNFCDFDEDGRNNGNCADIKFFQGRLGDSGGAPSGFYKSYNPDIHGQCMNDGHNEPGDVLYNDWKECCDEQLPWRSYSQCAPHMA